MMRDEYRVSYNRTYGWRWWSPSDKMPPGETHVRDADGEDMAAIKRIEAAARRNALAAEAVAQFERSAARSRLV
jgi:hypothetical protein